MKSKQTFFLLRYYAIKTHPLVFVYPFVLAATICFLVSTVPAHYKDWQNQCKWEGGEPQKPVPAQRLHH